MYICSKCKESKPETEFGKQASSKSGLQAYCKPCRRAYDAARKLKAKRVPEFKTCSECRVSKPSGEFVSHGLFKDGLQIYCKECGAKLSRQRYADNPEYLKQWALANSDRCKVHSQRHSARRRAITKAAVTDGAPVVSIDRLVEIHGRSCLYPGCDSEDPTLDHVVPLSRGGTHDVFNFQPLCRSHNSSKHAKTIDYRHSGWQDKLTEFDK